MNTSKNLYKYEYGRYYRGQVEADNEADARGLVRTRYCGDQGKVELAVLRWHGSAVQAGAC